MVQGVGLQCVRGHRQVISCFALAVVQRAVSSREDPLRLFGAARGEQHGHLVARLRDGREDVHTLRWEVSLGAGLLALSEAPPGVHDVFPLLVVPQVDEVPLPEAEEGGALSRGVVVHHSNHVLGARGTMNSTHKS